MGLPDSSVYFSYIVTDLINSAALNIRYIKLV